MSNQTLSTAVTAVEAGNTIVLTHTTTTTETFVIESAEQRARIIDLIAQGEANNARVKEVEELLAPLEEIGNKIGEELHDALYHSGQPSFRGLSLV